MLTRQTVYLQIGFGLVGHELELKFLIRQPLPNQNCHTKIFWHRWTFYWLFNTFIIFPKTSEEPSHTLKSMKFLRSISGRSPFNSTSSFKSHHLFLFFFNHLILFYCCFFISESAVPGCCSNWASSFCCFRRYLRQKKLR